MPTQSTIETQRRSRGPMLLLLGVLMLAVLVGVLWAAGLSRNPAATAINQPEQAQADHTLTSRTPKPANGG